MFKQASFADEIYAAMENNLVSNQAESTYGFSKLAQAVEYLNNAADIFDRAGMAEVSEDIAQVLEQVAETVR